MCNIEIVGVWGKFSALHVSQFYQFCLTQNTALCARVNMYSTLCRREWKREKHESFIVVICTGRFV